MRLTPFLWFLASCAVSAATEEQINKTFPASAGGKLVVDVDIGAIEVRTNQTGEVAVDVWRKVTRRNKATEEQFLRDCPVQFLHEGSTVTIRCRSKQSNGWFSGWRNRNEGKYTLRVPAQFNTQLHTSGGGIAVCDLAGETKANTSGGELRFERLRGLVNGDTSGGGIHVVDCDGPIKIDTSGGGITVLGGGGSLQGETSGGGVTVKKFVGPVSVNTSGGGITIENVRGKVKGSTSGGPISAVLVSPIPDEVNLSTSGGGVTARVAENAAFNLDAETSGGSVTCEVPVTVLGKTQHGRLKGTANGGGPAVILRSSGGGIHVKKL